MDFLTCCLRSVHSDVVPNHTSLEEQVFRLRRSLYFFRTLKKRILENQVNIVSSCPLLKQDVEQGLLMFYCPPSRSAF